MKIAFGKLSYSSDENYIRNRLFFESEDSAFAFSAEGFIENQPALKESAFAARDSAYCGCGWIALWNLCKISGEVKDIPSLIADTEKYSILGGTFGTNPFSFFRLLRQYGFSAMPVLSKKKFIKETPEKGVIMYLRKNLSAHYMAFKRTGAGLFRFYNSGKRLCKAVALEDFIKTEKPLFVLYYTVK